MVVAIDGPAGVGKSTVARELARRLGALYVSSGLAYRAAAWGILKEGLSAAREDAVAAWVGNHHVNLVSSGAEVRAEVDAEDVTARLHTSEISAVASHVAAIPAVRKALLPCQRRFAAETDVVMEGRDIGTVVFPDADHKFYLDAGEATRARRRDEDLRSMGLAQEYPLVREAIRARDALDSTRSASPLVQAPDAVRVNTDNLTVEQVVEMLIVLIAEKTRTGAPQSQKSRHRTNPNKGR